MSSVVTLKEKRDKNILRGHPWIFTGAVDSVHGEEPAPGETVDVHDAGGAWIARGAYSPSSQILVRVWTRDPAETVDEAFFRKRLERALATRRRVLRDRPNDACRLVHSESDGLPGLTVDRYGEFLVCQFTTAGADRWKAQIVESLQALNPCAGIYERSDLQVREREGLRQATGVLAGEAPPEFVTMAEGENRFLVDLRHGQKTGFYLDQRDSRTTLAEFSREAEVLNTFAYTGGFCVAALRGGATQVTNVDTSGPALRLALQNVELNGLDASKVVTAEADVFATLREHNAAGRKFDVVVLDPPKFADSKANLNRACRGYKDVNLQALRLLREGGTLLTFSCSGLMDPMLFQKIVADAALDAGRDAQILRWLRQPFDHPVDLQFPEGAYLKGLVCRVW